MSVPVSYVRKGLINSMYCQTFWAVDTDLLQMSKSPGQRVNAKRVIDWFVT